MRLLLVGDDDVLDALAELTRHLDYFEVARMDDPPEGALGERDHVVIAYVDGARARGVLAQRVQTGAGFGTRVPEARAIGARALRAAAALLPAGPPPSG